MSTFHGHYDYVERWARPDAVDDVLEEELADEVTPVRADRAEKIVRRFLRLCEHPRTSRRMLASVQSVVEGRDSGLRLFRLVNTVTRPLSVSGTATDKVMRHQLVGFILAGVATGRYLRDLEPMCSASEDDVVTLVAPAVRAALRGASPSSD